MSNVPIKSKEHDELVIPEKTGVVEQTVEPIPPSNTQKRKQTEEISLETPNKRQHTSDENRATATTTKLNEDCLSVPFWKQLNRKQASNQFQSRLIGDFSLLNGTNDKECFEDKRYLRVYKYPLQTLNVNFDLKVGESEFISENSSKNIDAMLWWILRHKQEIFKNDQFTFDFLSWRGVLRLIMFSIYEKHSDWLLAVIKFKNAYFLCEYTTDLQLKDETNMTPEHRSFCYYGHKFEEYVTKNATANEIMNPSKQFTGVFQSTIESHRLLYGAEMDCVLEKESSNTEHIELKICAGKSLNDLPLQYNRKFAKWWIQCFLAGIETMVIGLRDNNGIVSRLSPLNIYDIEQATHTWTRQSFFNFFLLFANFLKKHVNNEYSLEQKEVMLFHFSPSTQKITVNQSSDAKYHFLPDWFFNGFT